MATKEPSKDQAEAQADKQARERASAKEQAAAKDQPAAKDQGKAQAGTAAEERAQEMPKHGPEAEGEHPPGYDADADVNAIPSSSIELPAGQEAADEDAPPVGLPQTVAEFERERVAREEADRESAMRQVLGSDDDDDEEKSR